MASNFTKEQMAHYNAFLDKYQAWFEDMAIDHAFHMTGEFRFQNVLDIPEEPYAISRHAELRYRRGYTHGYSQGMDDSMANPSKPTPAWVAAARFFDNALMKWRKGPCTGLCPPPRFNRSDKTDA